MQRISNQTKVVLFPDNYQEQAYITKEKCIAVQHYSYTLQRNRNAYGEPDGRISGSAVTLTIRVGSRDSLRLFYQRLTQHYSSTYSLLFDATYDVQGYLTDQSGALIVEGYVVDVQELFDRDQANEEGEQMSLVCEILLTSVSCVGMNHLLKETFSN